MTPSPRQLLPDLFVFQDTCNVYLLREGDAAVAVDFGSGRWMKHLPALGVKRLEHVFLTHSHPDQCEGLCASRRRPFVVHAPATEAALLDPDKVAQFWKTHRFGAWPPGRSVLRKGVAGVAYDVGEGRDFFWRPGAGAAERICFLATPGHGQGAQSVIANWRGKMVVFCGDAAHAGAAMWRPCDVEWDHWTWRGPMAAWNSAQRLEQIGMDLLCPSHGPAVAERPNAMLRRLRQKLLAFVESKLSLCAGEKDAFWPLEPIGGQALRVLPHVVLCRHNTYLLLSDAGEALAVDPHTGEMDDLDAALEMLGRPKLTAAISSHFHSDHTDGLPLARARYGTRVCLHPRVAWPLANPRRWDLPFLPKTPIRPDVTLPEQGAWRWNEYEFQVAPWPGQTWWHAAYQVSVDKTRVFFGGDSFQPASRWNGTGGYSSFNGIRLREGYVPSSRLIRQWKPDVLCNGHHCVYRYTPSRFRRIEQWALKTEKAIQALCPSGDLDKDYYMHPSGGALTYPGS